MMNRFKSYFKKFISDNGGMSIVTVVIAIGFVSILVSILLLTAAINFKMKNVNMYSKDSFYSAEQVLDELNIGLQQIVSDGLSVAYTKALENYTADEMSADEKNQLVQAEYYKYIWEKLGYDSAHKNYLCEDESDNKAGLYGLLKESTQWHANADMNKEYGAFIRSAANNKGASGEYLGTMTSYEDKGIVLEGVQVYYKDPNGFVSELQTDIRLAYPDFSFANSNMPDISSYVYITDGGYEEHSTGKATTTVKGNTYAYMMDVRNTDIDNVDTKLGEDIHIIATDCKLDKSGYKTNDNSITWAGDITAKSSDVDLSGTAYVKDDLNLTGAKSSVEIKGYYYGYGNGNPDAIDLNSISPESSSAILVNGSSTTVDLSKAKKVSIAGHAFVSANKSKDKETNVFTGESVAVKSNQIMYLIPGECLVDKETGDSYGMNPISLKTVLEASESGETRTMSVNGIKDYVTVDPNANVNKLAGPLKDFIAFTGTEPDFETIMVPSVSDPSDNLIYFYMKFKDENAANYYFARYYSLNKEYFNQYIDNYLKVLKLPDEGNKALRLRLAGGVVAGDELEGFDNPGYVIEDGMTTFVPENSQFTYEFYGYCSKLSPDYDNIATIADIKMFGDKVDSKGYPEAVMFDNLIDEDTLKIMDGTYKDDEGKNAVQLIYRADSNATVGVDETCSLVVANCNVEVGSDFKGTIIAKGKMTVAGGVNLEADNERVEECMLIKYVDPKDEIEYRVSNVFKDSDELKYIKKTDDIDASVSVSDLVIMENWIKR